MLLYITMEKALLLVVALAGSAVFAVEGATVCCEDLGCYDTGGDFFHLLHRHVSQAPNNSLRRSSGRLLSSNATKSFAPRTDERVFYDSSGKPVFYGTSGVLQGPLPSLPDCELRKTFKLHLNTRQNPDTTTVIDPYTPPSFTSSGFQFDKDTKIIVHGFTDNYAWSWWADVKTAYLAEADVNVIRVEWSRANTLPLLQAAGNARLLGSYIAKFINQLKNDRGYSPSKIHLIGHSLGAQVVGYAGAQVDKVGRITGIDPAGMYFANMPASVRLDPTDATLVDTIVTDSGSILQMAFGSTQAMGHLNFYVNGGKNQPGCDQSLFETIFGGPSSFDTSTFDAAAIVTQTGYQAVMCNHYRALALFTETIRSNKCALTMYRCSSYEQFQQGKCFDCANGGCSKMGEHLDASLLDPVQQKSFYGFTTDRPSYCTQTYRLKFKLQHTSSANFNEARKERGYVFVTLYGSQGISSRFNLTPEEIDLEPGQEYGFLFNTPQSLGAITSIEFYWDARFNILNPTEWIRRHYLYIDGNLEITSEKSSTLFKLPLNKVEEEKPFRANLVSGKSKPFGF